MKQELESIRRIRASNNNIWMNILEIALRHAPVETRQALKQIRANDLAVSELTGILADENLDD